MKTGEGFVYIWRDNKRNLYYIGSHMGSLYDGYVGSNARLKATYNARPETMKRRILEHYYNISSKELRNIEQAWLSLIKDEELHGVRYLNEKKVATGGDIISSLTPEKKEQHKEKSVKAFGNNRHKWREWVESLDQETLSQKGKYARSCVKNPNGGSMPGETNPFYGKTHSDATRQKMSERAKNRKPNRRENYVIEFPDGTTEFHAGQKSIKEKYCIETTIAFNKFIDTNKPIQSKHRKNHVLTGAKIKRAGMNNENV